MSYTVSIAKECGCFKRSGVELPKTFDDKDEALKEANALAEEFNETFCKKHNFGVVENGEDLVISVEMA